MLQLADVMKKFEDKDFIRKLALLYIRHGRTGSFKQVEALMKIEQGVLDSLFFEYPKFDEAFSNEVRVQGQKRLQRQAVPKLFDLIQSLTDISEDSEDVTGSERLRAATVLSAMLQKLAALEKDSAKKSDDLDDLWEELGNESNTAQSSTNM